jgi:flagellar biosynthesis protein FlhF
MKLKSYFAASVEDAIALARQELGPEAMLVHSKKAAAESRHLGEYEIVFAAEAELAHATSPRPESPTDKSAALNRLADDIGSMRRQIERMAAALGYAAVAQGSVPFTRPEAAQPFAALVRAGTHPEIAHEFAVRASSTAGRTSENLERVVRESLRTDTWEKISPPGQRIAAFIGPPGAGKTTTLAKVAAIYGLGRRISTHVLTCDVRRIAAAEQLRTLCSILGIGFQAVETPLALEQALMEHGKKGLVLIDTPGTSRKDSFDFDGFAAFFASRPDIEKHLVLPASMKQEDLSRIADQHTLWAYTHLVFSKMDETSTFGCILNETQRTGRPVSFLSGGQEVPEDLEAADPYRLAGIVLGSEYAAAEASRAAA